MVFDLISIADGILDVNIVSLTDFFEDFIARHQHNFLRVSREQSIHRLSVA